MLRRSLALLAALAVFAAVASAATAARVKVRVEGRTQTIFGATEKTLDVRGPEVTIPERITPNAVDALETASVLGEFYYHVTPSAFGPYVDQIGRYRAAGTAGWVFKVNGVSPPVGADQLQLEDGDRVLWYWATFGESGGGPETLLLRRTKARCYAVTAQNDAGVARAAVGAVFHVDGRRVQTRSGQACVGKHRGLVRATLPGAVRSNAVR